MGANDKVAATYHPGSKPTPQRLGLLQRIRLAVLAFLYRVISPRG